MGKFLYRITEEQQEKYAERTLIENALYDAGFRWRYTSCDMQRCVEAASTAFDPRTGRVRVCMGRKQDVYTVPRKIMENDDAEAFMGWLDKMLEKWL